MHRVRASSYIRRTISEPFARHKSISSSAVHFKKESTIPFFGTEVQSVTEEKASTPTYTLSTDLYGLQDLLFTRLNLLLIFVPIGIASSYFSWGYFPSFWLNFLALIPLAGVLGVLTEELALHTGDLIGGLLNATFGNAVEMIVTLQALSRNLVDIVQGTLLGSILSNLLLVLGMAFFCGGLFHHIQKFNARGATCSTSLLLLASLGIIVPTVVSNSTEHLTQDKILIISRLTALLIAMTYCLFLFFQLGTHLSIFKDERSNSVVYAGNDTMENVYYSQMSEDWPSISATCAVIGLFLVTFTVSVCSDALVQSIEGLSENTRISKTFIGVILLPIVGNAAEHATAVTVAIKDKPDLTMGVAIGSSTQIAMFMVPFAVLAGWVMNVPMTLVFSNVSATVLTFSILIVIGIVQDGESNWLEGVMLMIAYCIIAIAYWFF